MTSCTAASDGQRDGGGTSAMAQAAAPVIAGHDAAAAVAEEDHRAGGGAGRALAVPDRLRLHDSGRRRQDRQAGHAAFPGDGFHPLSAAFAPCSSLRPCPRLVREQQTTMPKRAVNR